MNVKDFINPTVTAIPPSGIRKFFDVVGQMDGAISLGVGEPDFVTPWNVREAAIYSSEHGETHYTSNRGLSELCNAISLYLERRFNLKYGPSDQIMVTVGASEGIDLAMRAIITPGDEVLIPEPSYVSYSPCVALSGGKAVGIKTNHELKFKLTPEAIEEAITPKTRAIILPYPNNPTGAIMTREDLIPIVETLKKHDIIIVSDEIYGELTYSDQRHVSIAEFKDMYDRTIVLNGFSKSFAMTGWRLGYACGHPDLISGMLKIHQYVMLCAPIMSQKAAYEGLIQGLKYGFTDVEKMRRAYNRMRRMMVSKIHNIGLECFEPEGAFYIFPSIKNTGLTSLEFCERLLQEEKVAIVPGTAFGPSGEGHVRCSYAYSIENIKAALERIERFVNNLKK
jgi:aminotransferase